MCEWSADIVFPYLYQGNVYSRMLNLVVWHTLLFKGTNFDDDAGNDDNYGDANGDVEDAYDGDVGDVVDGDGNVGDANGDVDGDVEANGDVDDDVEANGDVDGDVEANGDVDGDVDDVDGTYTWYR